jgi:hypothetical protein
MVSGVCSARRDHCGSRAELLVAAIVERKLGQMLQGAKAAGQITHFHRGQHFVPNENNIVRLDEIGISPKLSMGAQSRP